MVLLFNLQERLELYKHYFSLDVIQFHPIALGGELGALCYWRQNPGYIDEAIYAWPPGDEVEFGVDVMIRTLQGQGPRIQSILVGPATKSFDDIAAVLK